MEMCLIGIWKPDKKGYKKKKDTGGSWLESDGDELVESKTGMELSNNLPSPSKYK